MPDTGILQTYKLPSGPGVRVDNGIEEGMEVPIYYDPMLAKLIVHAASRPEAIERMKRAIGEFQVTGIETTLQFGLFAMNHEAFKSGNFDTHFISTYFNLEKESTDSADKGSVEEASVAALLGAGLLNTVRDPIQSGRVVSGDMNGWRKNRKIN